MPSSIRVWRLGFRDPGWEVRFYLLPVTEKTYLFGTIETMIRNPKKVGLFGYR